MESPTGTIVFASVGRPFYGFDIFSVNLPSTFDEFSAFTEHRLTDGVSINFNGQFAGEDGGDLVYVSERTGSALIYLNRFGEANPQQLRSPPESLFHDRPAIKNGRLYFISAHEPNDTQFKSWSALYSTALDEEGKKSPDHVTRLTPYGSVDYSPSISRSGKLIAVASYGSRRWAGEFHALQTGIVVFQESDSSKRVLVCQNGGWPSWYGDSVLYFHRRADDGWWSIFRVDLPDDFVSSPAAALAPIRVTPAGVHCFTPAAMHDSNLGRIALSTRRKGKNYRHIEIFDLQSKKFYPVTELLNPNFHHYNPFVSKDSSSVGYHRFRGEDHSSTIPHLAPVTSFISGLHMLRLNGTFPSFSPSGDLIVFNPDFEQNSGLKIVRSDGSKRWTLIDNRTAFYNSWSSVDDNVVFTSIGPIFESVTTTVQIARVTFDPSNLTDGDANIPVDIKILTREETGNNAFPSCSPDGKSVVFRSGRSGHKNLYIVDAIDGEFDGGIRQITEGPWTDTMPSWSPDGKLIAFSSNRHSRAEAFGLYVMKPDSTDVRKIQISALEDQDRERLNHVCFSGDGEWLLFAANLAAVTAEPVSLPNHFQPYGDLYIVKLDGSGLQRLTANGYENGTPCWHPHPEVCLPMAASSSTGDEHDLDFSQLSLKCDAEEDKSKGQFEEPLWIKCDF